MKRVFSGVQPSGNLTIGNYLGALKQFVELQNEADAFYCVVDLHALTVQQDPEELRKRSREIAQIYLACGVDPVKSTVFIQSHVREHAELGWLLQCVSYMGELNRMTQFKDKAEGKANVTVGLYTYPVLMAADILLYDTTHVPVGDDQKQHIELTRDIAERFNNRFGETFVIPNPQIQKFGARIMSLTEPNKKMSKSAENEKSRIAILEDPATFKKKIMSAVTDTDNEIRFDEENKPGISNLLSLYSLFTGDSLDATVARFQGEGYGTLKKQLVEVMTDKLGTIQARYHELSQDPAELDRILATSAERARTIAEQTVNRVKDAMGLVRL
ncbi:tryptophan--tRNA ligase [Tumebacillus permanentifrigoris]|uniref:Tryptophan--tRNA ligase n=1 Tax=Tumebacillus permanentifrigoris TaxID=378543 RepID=A0A316D2Q9_9BACL|nr:tryptophan--tRNA ligase [Tumebacillus permanentifrigoris]PWK05205.1 tryptophanyl-tRNA synthetase [Tumebacillus permanentifrigoris]